MTVFLFPLEYFFYLIQYLRVKLFHTLDLQTLLLLYTTLESGQILQTPSLVITFSLL